MLYNCEGLFEQESFSRRNTKIGIFASPLRSTAILRVALLKKQLMLIFSVWQDQVENKISLQEEKLSESAGVSQLYSELWPKRLVST